MNYWNRKTPKIYIYFSQQIQENKWKQNSNQKNSNSAVEKKEPRDDSSPMTLDPFSVPWLTMILSGSVNLEVRQNAVL